jgi:hypothetical protein
MELTDRHGWLGPGITRAGDADREAYAAVLRKAFEDGQLTLEHLEARLTDLWAAEAHRDLAVFTADLTRPEVKKETARAVKTVTVPSLAGYPAWIITELMTVFLLWLPYITGSTRKHLDLGIFMSVCGALTVLFTICAWSSADDERRKKIADG